MYLHSLKLWNWRKFKESESGDCGIEVEFKEGLNIIVGENDAGKTAIVDALKSILSTNNQDTNWITEDDFHKNKNNLKIECVFKKLSINEEAFFYEWLTIKPDSTELRVVLEAEIYTDINNHRKIKRLLKAGEEDLERGLDDSVKNILAATYLKPLRDAASELSPGKRSRIAQVVKHLNNFSEESTEHQQILSNFSTAFDELKDILKEPVLDRVEQTIDNFFAANNKKSPEILNRDMSFVEILRRLELNLGEIGAGLGSSNLLFMAIELLLLSESEIGPKIALIEEVEAHIHPQAQLRILKHFEDDTSESGIQYIFTSHSPVLAASVSIESIILLYRNKAFPMKKGETKLEEEDYEFLERFLDATKANLFFAQGVILVEGDAENLLVPSIAEVIDSPLHRYGISIVNIGSLAFKRYSNIFLRENIDKPMNFPVSIITDVDLKPVDYYDQPSYIKIDSVLNSEIAQVYDSQEIINDFEKTYITLNDLKSEANKIYDNQSPEISQRIEEIVSGSSPNFIGFLEEKEANIKFNYSHDTEKTKVYQSKPWTLEHSIALSSLGIDFEKILLDSHYQRNAEKQNMQRTWNEITDQNKRATAVYKFLLEKKVSKAIVAQNFSKYLIDNKLTLKEKILSDPHLIHLVNAIYHAVGAEEIELSGQ